MYRKDSHVRALPLKPNISKTKKDILIRFSNYNTNQKLELNSKNLKELSLLNQKIKEKNELWGCPYK
jgi:hypothetical protein